MGSTLSVQTASRADLAEVDALLARSYPALLKDDYPPSVRVTAIPIISKAQPALVLSGTYYVVRDVAGDMVGAGGWTHAANIVRDTDDRVGNVRHVVTDHRRVRQGIGRALMHHIFAEARTQQVERLDCMSTRMAEPFYAACGFKRSSEISVPLASGIVFPAILMHALV